MFISSYIFSCHRFGCDPGYMLLGPRSTRCEGGVWAKGVPYCIRDVAIAKPAYMEPFHPENSDMSSHLPEFAVDGNDDTCAETDASWGTRMWGVALLEEATVSTLKMVFGKRLEQAELEVFLQIERIFK